MSVTTNAAGSTQNIASLVLQQLLSGSNSQADSSLPPSVLEEVLSSAQASQQSTQAPASVVKALSNLLSGKDTAGDQGDLSQVQAYFKENPGSLFQPADRAPGQRGDLQLQRSGQLGQQPADRLGPGQRIQFQRQAFHLIPDQLPARRPVLGPAAGRPRRRQFDLLQQLLAARVGPPAGAKNFHENL